MNKLFIKLYDLITAPLYRRLARDLTLQLQEISKSYLDQHEMLTAKMLDELLRLNIRLEQSETTRIARHKALEQLEEPLREPHELAPEQIFDLIKESARSLDVVEVCSRHNIPLTMFYELESKYRGLDPSHIRRVKLLEETNLELRGLLSKLMHQQATTGAPNSLDTEMPREKVANGNERG